MKIKVALLLGYEGTNYCGLQYSANVKTIEEVILKNLVKLQAIKKENFDPKKAGFQRACRTDKGVHAIYNVVVCKIIREIEDICEPLKQELQKENIFLYKIVKVPKSWVVKNRVDYRIYEYFIPKSILRKKAIVSENINTALEIVKERNLKREEKQQKKKEYKNIELFNNINFIEEEISMKEIKDLLQNFIGSKNYHNFTINKNEKGTQRHILDIETEDIDNYIKIIIKGQSFLLHQIRKMIGALLLAKIFKCPKIFDIAFTKKKINIPKTPSKFLLLKYPSFEFYNKKYTESHNPIEVEDTEYVKNIIYNKIKDEKNLEGFDEWLKTVVEYFYEFTYLLENKI